MGVGGSRNEWGQVFLSNGEGEKLRWGDTLS